MTILELREKRAKAWDAAKAFLDSHRTDKGVLSAEDDATYSRMEQEISDLGKEIARMERREALDAELNKPVNYPITGKPAGDQQAEKKGRASDAYKRNFWNAMRLRGNPYEIRNALQEGTDSEGGYLVPDEYERTLVQALEEENVFRRLAKVIQTSSGDRKIPIVTSHGSAAWLDEEDALTESDEVFGQTSLSAYKLGTFLKVSDELLNDSVFDLPSYISTEFARRIGAKEEEAFFVGDGNGKPTGIFSSRLVCGDCGGYFGSKVWHSTDKYRRTIWRCNSKFTGEEKCQTPHLTGDEIKARFLDAFNMLVSDKERMLDECRTMQAALTDTGSLDSEIAALLSEIEVVAELTKRCIEENSTTAQDQTAYLERYNALGERYETAKAKLEKLRAVKAKRESKAEDIGGFMFELAEYGDPITEFDDRLWLTVIDIVTVHRDGQLTFKFQTGHNVTVA